MFAARIGPRLVAKTDTMDKMRSIKSRFHRGQLRGSLGSSLGCGESIIGIGPELSHFNLADSEAAA